jgi:hypothetical protein
MGTSDFWQRLGRAYLKRHEIPWLPHWLRAR